MTRTAYTGAPVSTRALSILGLATTVAACVTGAATAGLWLLSESLPDLMGVVALLFLLSAGCAVGVAAHFVRAVRDPSLTAVGCTMFAAFAATVAAAAVAVAGFVVTL